MENQKLWTKKELFIITPVLLSIALLTTFAIAGPLFVGSLLYVLALLPIVFFAWKFEQEGDWSGVMLVVIVWIVVSSIYLSYVSPIIMDALPNSMK